MAAHHGIRQTATVKKPLTAVRRLKQDYMMIMKDPVPYVDAAPLPSNILEWYCFSHQHCSQMYVYLLTFLIPSGIM